MTRPEDPFLTVKMGARPDAPGPEQGESLSSAFVQRNTLDACATSERMAQVLRPEDSRVRYPASGLAGRSVAPSKSVGQWRWGRVLQAMLLTNLKTATTTLLCGLVVGLVLGAKVGSSLWFTSTELGVDGKEEAVYQGQPTSFWIGQLQDHDQFFRLEAVQALEQIGPKEKAVVLALAKMLNDRTVGVRIGTALALGRFGPEAKLAIPELLSCLKHRDRHVRVSAVRALGNIGPSDAAVLAALISALEDEESVVRRITLETMGSIGPRAKMALPAIRKAQKDRNPEVSQEAVDALKKIGHQDATDGPSSEGSTSSQARQLLEALSRGAPNAALTRDAQGALERLAQGAAAKP